MSLDHAIAQDLALLRESEARLTRLEMETEARLRLLAAEAESLRQLLDANAERADLRRREASSNNDHARAIRALLAGMGLDLESLSESDSEARLEDEDDLL